MRSVFVSLEEVGMKVLVAVQDPDDADSRFRSAEVDPALAVWECFETG